MSKPIRWPKNNNQLRTGEYSPNRIVKFGKYKGKRYYELSENYLKFIIKNFNKPQWLIFKDWALRELSRRKS